MSASEGSVHDDCSLAYRASACSDLVSLPLPTVFIGRDRLNRSGLWRVSAAAFNASRAQNVSTPAGRRPVPRPLKRAAPKLDEPESSHRIPAWNKSADQTQARPVSRYGVDTFEAVAANPRLSARGAWSSTCSGDPSPATINQAHFRDSYSQTIASFSPLAKRRLRGDIATMERIVREDFLDSPDS